MKSNGYRHGRSRCLAGGAVLVFASLAHFAPARAAFTEFIEFGTSNTIPVAWGDFDGDGDYDLAVGDYTNGPKELWVNQGDGSFIRTEEFGTWQTFAIAWGDYDIDGDGDLDLATGNEHHPTQNNLYRNEANDGASVILHLVGHRYDQGAGYSNRDGIGARVTVYEAGFLGDPAHRVGYREVEARGGFSPQGAIDPHFGVPSGATVDIRIAWPGSDGSNIVQDVTGVAVGARTTVHESAAITGVEEAESGRDVYSSLRVAPNPVRDRVSFRMASSGPVPAGLEVYDTRGRLVRNLRLQRAGSGSPSRASRAIPRCICFIERCSTARRAPTRSIRSPSKRGS